jgi:hypothetical protein
LESDFRVLVVQLVLDGQAEEALELLAKHYNIDFPRLKVGLPKRHRRGTRDCYTAKSETISVLNSDALKEPSIILHEFYHHLRTSSIARPHKGTERHATRFAEEFIDSHKSAVTKTGTITCFRDG